jgi:hypothetical protein
MLPAGTVAWFSSHLVSIKTYYLAVWLWGKPLAIATIMKGGWLTGLSILEWSAGRAYAVNCIGSGITGWYDHIWSMGSAPCIAFLSSHVALIGVFLASFSVTFGIFVLWAIKKVENDQHTKDMVEFVKVNVFSSDKSQKTQNPNQNQNPNPNHNPNQNPNTYGSSQYNHNQNQYTSY